MTSTIPKTSYIPDDVPEVPSSIALEKRYDGHNYSLTDKSLPNDPKNYWTCLSRKGCGSLWSGEQGESGDCSCGANDQVYGAEHILCRRLSRYTDHHHPYW